MDLYKLGIKLYVADGVALQVRDCIPVFHRWIQEQKVPGHLLIDVHDYAHVSDGPGILLVAHEGNFSLDSTDGRPGLVYYRKQPIEGDVADKLAAILKTVLSACALLEAEDSLRGLRFKRDEMLVFSNDRLLAPNTTESRPAFEPVVRRFATAVFPGGNVTVSLASSDKRDRLGMMVRSSVALTV